jgi:hypothetical protein
LRALNASFPVNLLHWNIGKYRLDKKVDLALFDSWRELMALQIAAADP